jgi:hypothetical protein
VTVFQLQSSASRVCLPAVTYVSICFIHSGVLKSLTMTLVSLPVLDQGHSIHRDSDIHIHTKRRERERERQRERFRIYLGLFDSIRQGVKPRLRIAVRNTMYVCLACICWLQLAEREKQEQSGMGLRGGRGGWAKDLAGIVSSLNSSNHDVHLAHVLIILWQ